jgi:L-aminopeptidase/D-esterase-like protein
MACVIQPFHTLNDGDILFAVSTEEVDAASWDPMALGQLCSDLAWKAIRAAVCPMG